MDTLYRPLDAHHMDIRILLLAPSEDADADIHCEFEYAWVDAICINQSDLQERASQVAIMQGIYWATNNTLMWIGDHSGSSKDAFEFIYMFVGALCARTRASATFMHQLCNGQYFQHYWPAFGSPFQRPAHKYMRSRELTFPNSVCISSAIRIVAFIKYVTTDPTYTQVYAAC